MNELSYIISLSETLANFVNSEENPSKRKFTQVLLQILIDGKRTSHPLSSLNENQKNIYLTSIKLLFKKYDYNNIENYATQFIREENQELMPGYELILSSINPNDLDDKELTRFTRPLRVTSNLKEKMIVAFLFGSRFNQGLKDGTLLTRLGSKILESSPEEIKVHLLDNLSSQLRPQVERNPAYFRNALRNLAPELIIHIEGLDNGNRYNRLHNVLNSLMNQDE